MPLQPEGPDQQKNPEGNENQNPIQDNPQSALALLRANPLFQPNSLGGEIAPPPNDQIADAQNPLENPNFGGPMPNPYFPQIPPNPLEPNGPNSLENLSSSKNNISATGKRKHPNEGPSRNPNETGKEANDSEGSESSESQEPPSTISNPKVNTTPVPKADTSILKNDQSKITQKKKNVSFIDDPINQSKLSQKLDPNISMKTNTTRRRMVNEIDHAYQQMNKNEENQKRSTYQAPD